MSFRFALPKGRMQEGVLALLQDAGIRIATESRGYRPRVSIAGIETKILKPQNIVEMLHMGTRDLGFAGADVEELLDTGLDPVRVVVAAPQEILVGGRLPRRPLVLASEYERLAKAWVREKNIEATFLRSYGATEVFPPEDADVIVDNTATGSTLEANRLIIVDEILTSSTRLYASRGAMADARKRVVAEDFALLLKAVLEARRRVMVEINVAPEALERVVAVLPCMREPTIAPLHASKGFAVKAAVPRKDLPTLIPAIRAQGGTDIVVCNLNQIVP